MGTLLRALTIALCLGGAAQAQPPAQPGQRPAQPEIPEALRLERDNLLLQARVNELETQLAAVKAQLINEQIGKVAPVISPKPPNPSSAGSTSPPAYRSQTIFGGSSTQAWRQPVGWSSPGSSMCSPMMSACFTAPIPFRRTFCGRWLNSVTPFGKSGRRS